MRASTPRLAAALIALVCWVGLALNFSATYAHQGNLVATLWRLGHFFTIISNVAVALAMTRIALGGRVSPFMLSALTLAILLVGIVYVLLLHGLHPLSGRSLIANHLLHYVSPVAMAAYWLLFTPHGRLQWRDPFWWGLFPLIYFVYVIGRGLAGGGYPYPFIDVRKLGMVQTAINALGIAAGFTICGYVLVFADRRLLGRGRAKR
ncbi:MAG TPA: Pr6Pr family membrane protein [Sphingomicrobium sp.]